MRLLFLCFFSLVSLSLFAQPLSNENTISGDDLREMIIEVFESQEGQTVQQADAENGQEVILLINSTGGYISERIDIRNALIDLRANPYELNLEFSMQIVEEDNQSEISLNDSQRAIRLGISREGNRATLYFRREDVSEKKQYNLFSIFEKEGEEWRLINQNLRIRP